MPSFTSLVPIGLLPPPSKEFSDIDYVEGDARFGVRYVAGPGENVGADAAASAPRVTEGAPNPSRTSFNPQGLPLMKPPYGRITAINLDKGEFVWQIAHGETPDYIRNHPALKGMNIPRTGQAGYSGVLVTKTLVIAADSQVTTTPEHPRGAMLRGYDKATGKAVGAVYMPAPQSGSPMTYSVNGKQYIVIAISGGTYSGEYLAFALAE
jgi:quinoprotein glucose dehydrogenase